MILIFDLDDTLYDESTYVEGGFRAVAAYGKREHGWNARASFDTMMEILRRDGRGAVFNRWLQSHGVGGIGEVRRCVKVYRHHTPKLELEASVRAMLRRLATDHRLFVVTDGHKIVQAKKVEALGVDRLVEKAYITHRYGVHNAKPSTYCFERIKDRARCSWGEMLYVGDNPAKDFVNLKPLGVHTVRVLTGVHKKAKAARGYDARHRIPNLDRFEALLKKLDR